MGKYRDEEISWRVLCVKNGKALLISEKVLDKKLFDEAEKSGITWEKCTLRNWLNNAFYNLSFSQQEKKKIAVNTLRYRDSRVVKDFVFLFSIDEANKYFLDNEDRKATPTEYVKNNIKPYRNESITHRPWWLRSPSSFDYYCASFVSSSGKVSEDERYVYNNTIYIRPALWIYL